MAEQSLAEFFKGRIKSAKVKPPEADGKVFNLCEICQAERTMHCETGCPRWRENAAIYWQRNIYRKMDIPNLNREKFQIYHPDEVREGIVWSGN